MKHQRKNSEKLMDEMAYLGNDTIADCMRREASQPKSKARLLVNYRKFTAIAAACMAVVMVLGAMMAAPMLMANNTVTPPVGETQPAGTPAPNTSSSYQPATVVKLQALASPRTLTQDGAIDETYDQVTFDTTYLNHIFFRENMVLAFDIQAGESITVTSQKSDINPVTYPEDFPKEADQDTQLEWLKMYCGQFAWETQKRVTSHTLTEQDSFLMWNNTEKVTMGEDILTYVIRNTEGQITGAGSLLMVKYRPVDYTLNFFYDKASLVRWCELGCVRFDNPAEVSEDSVNELLAQMNQKAEEAKAELSFEPENQQEYYIKALADMVNACYDIKGSKEMGYVDFYTATDCSYFKLSIVNHRDETMRQFLLYADGTWQELMPDSFWVLTDPLMGARALFQANFADGTTRHMDEERAAYDTEDAVYYGYHFYANNIVWLELANSNFDVAMDSIMYFLFIDGHASGAFSYRVTPQVEDHDFREVFFTVGEETFHFMVFSNGSWGLIYEDSGYADAEALTGRKIVFTNGLVFLLEWQEVEKRGVEEPVYMLAPTYLDEVVSLPGDLFTKNN